jgi:hypothetical protein
LKHSTVLSREKSNNLGRHGRWCLYTEGVFNNRQCVRCGTDNSEGKSAAQQPCVIIKDLSSYNRTVIVLDEVLKISAGPLKAALFFQTLLMTELRFSNGINEKSDAPFTGL